MCLNACCHVSGTKGCLVTWNIGLNENFPSSFHGVTLLFCIDVDILYFLQQSQLLHASVLNPASGSGLLFFFLPSLVVTVSSADCCATQDLFIIRETMGTARPK